MKIHSMKVNITTFSNFILSVISLGLLSALIACSSSSSSSGGGGGSTPPTPSIALSTTPTSLLEDGAIPITATVSNDSGNGGVNWTCTPATTCGGFSAAKTASGAPTTYTAPATVPASPVVIVATLVDDSSVTGKTPGITIGAPNVLTVSLSTAPPTAIAPSGTATIAATVTNDSAHGGVKWSCTPSATCGSFNPTSTASAATTAYTAGTTLGNVVITATSASDNTTSASSTVTVTSAAGATLAAGNNYVFSLAGTDANGSAYYLAGVFTVSATGTISTGEQDFSDFNNEVHDTISSGTITPSTSSSSGDVNLTITLQTGDPCIGPGATTSCTGGTGQEVLVATLISSSKGLLIESDTWASSSGTLDLQSSTLSTPTGGYAFLLNGVDLDDFPTAMAGVINIDNSGGAGNISGTGSVFDLNDTGVSVVTLYPSQTFTSPSMVSGPDPLGLVTFTLNSGLFTGAPGLILVGYIVDSTHIRLVENWETDTYAGTTGGTALAQTGTGGFNVSSISGSNYVFGTAGADPSSAPLQVAGVLTFNADGSVTGNLSFNDFALQSPQGGSALAAEVAAAPCSSGTAVTPCYTVDPSGTGRVTITNLTDSTTSPTFVYNLELYLTGDGNGVAISMDTGDVQSGAAYQQSGTFTAASFAGSYVLNIDQQDTHGGLYGFEYDGVGTTGLDGKGNFTGFLDLTGILNSFLTPVTDDLLAGDFTANASGVFTGGIQGLSTTSGSTGDNFTYYLVDPTRAIAIENDTDQLTLGIFELQQ